MSISISAVCRDIPDTGDNVRFADDSRPNGALARRVDRAAIPGEIHTVESGGTNELRPRSARQSISDQRDNHLLHILPMLAYCRNQMPGLLILPVAKIDFIQGTMYMTM